MRKSILAALAVLATCAFAADLPPDTPLVTRGDLSVTVADFNAAMNKVPEEHRDEFRASLERVQTTVSNLYVNRALARDAEAAGIDREPEIQKRLQLLREGLLAQIYMERFEKTIVVPGFEARAREIYASTPDRYNVPDKVKFRQIFVAYRGRTKADALKRIQEARAKLVSETFAMVARDYTDDPSFRQNSGVFGPAAYSSVPPEIAAAARTQPLNEVGEPIETSVGYYLIIVEQRLPARVVKFEDVKAGLIKAEAASFRKQVVDKRLGEVTASKDVVLHTDNIAALKTDINPAVQKLKEDTMKREAAEAGRDAVVHEAVPRR